MRSEEGKVPMGIDRVEIFVDNGGHGAPDYRVFKIVWSSFFQLCRETHVIISAPKCLMGGTLLSVGCVVSREGL